MSSHYSAQQFGVLIAERPEGVQRNIVVFEQALSPNWSTLTLPAGEPGWRRLAWPARAKRVSTPASEPMA